MTVLFAPPAESLGMDDVAQVGGKNASLGEMYQHLKRQGVSGAACWL